MYFESTMHCTRAVDNAVMAARIIKTHDARDFDALTWTAANNRRLTVVADNHCNDPWLEVAVIDIDRQCQIESITAGWCNSSHELSQLFIECETTDFIFRRNVLWPLDGQNANASADFECGCCGTDFTSTYETQRRFDQDNGYGICSECSRYYS